MRETPIYLGFLFALTIFLLSSCNRNQIVTQDGWSLETSTSKPTDAEAQPTFLEATAKVTSMPTFILSSTPTPTLTTATLVPTPTWTPKPTLPPQQAQGTAVKVFETNGGCKFPCWMGITPGKTRWDQAKADLLPYADLYYDKKRTNLLDVNVMFKKPKGQDPVSFVGQMTIEDGIVTRVFANFSHKDLPLWQFLSENEKPEEIRIFANGNIAGLGDTGDFVLVLFYPNKGIMAAFRGASNQGKVLHICLEKMNMQSDYNLLLWHPNQALSFEQAGQRLGLPVRKDSSIGNDYVLLQHSASMDVETFYETYKQEGNLGKCFDVPDLGVK